MQRAQLIAVSCCLALLIACTNSSTDGATTTTTIPLAPTDCRDAPELPACRPGHGIDTRN